MGPRRSPGTKTIRVLLIDDHAVVRAGLRMLIESRPGIEVVGEADNYLDAVAVTAREQPDIILLDLVMGGESGLDYLPKLVSVAEQARVLILTGVRDPKVHQRAVQLGAMGVVLKGEAPEVLIKAIEKVHAGEAWLDRTSMANILAEISGSGKQQYSAESAHIETLTKREREIITLVAQGLKSKQIAERLRISDITVRHHLTSIYAKLRAADRFELILYAYRHGLADRPE
jgi:two-component system nitrate/nitrite response regulator NarL